MSLNLSGPTPVQNIPSSSKCDICVTPLAIIELILLAKVFAHNGPVPEPLRVFE